MKALGFFGSVVQEVGEIIVADVNKARVKEPSRPTGRAEGAHRQGVVERRPRRSAGVASIVSSPARPPDPKRSPGRAQRGALG